jgi:hypothetical protein
MSVTFMDGFDWCRSSVVPLTRKWNIGQTTTRTTGRYDGDTQPALAINGGSHQKWFDETDYVIASGALYCVIDYEVRIIAHTPATDKVHTRVRYNDDIQEFEVLDAGGSVVGTTSINATPSQWYHCVFGAYLHNSAGLAILKINGNTELTLTGLDTLNDATYSGEGVEFAMGGGPGGNRLDDVVIIATGTPDVTLASEMPGDNFIQTLWPRVDSTVHADWTPSSGSDHYAMVDDGDAGGGYDNYATYNETDTLEARDAFLMDAVDTSVVASVLAAQLNAQALTKDAGPDYLRLFFRDMSAATDYTGSVKWLLNSSDRVNWEVWNTDGGGSAWTAAEIDDTEWGYGKE